MFCLICSNFLDREMHSLDGGTLDVIFRSLSTHPDRHLLTNVKLLSKCQKLIILKHFNKSSSAISKPKPKPNLSHKIVQNRFVLQFIIVPYCTLFQFVLSFSAFSVFQLNLERWYSIIVGLLFKRLFLIKDQFKFEPALPFEVFRLLWWSNWQSCPGWPTSGCSRGSKIRRPKLYLKLKK